MQQTYTKKVRENLAALSDFDAGLEGEYFGTLQPVMFRPKEGAVLTPRMCDCSLPAVSLPSRVVVNPAVGLDKTHDPLFVNSVKRVDPPPCGERNLRVHLRIGSQDHFV